MLQQGSKVMSEVQSGGTSTYIGLEIVRNFPVDHDMSELEPDIIHHPKL